MIQLYDFDLTVNEANNWTTYTYFVMQPYAVLNPGLIVEQLGLYQPVYSGTWSLKVGHRTTAGTFNVLASVSIIHPGTGWADVQLPTPVLVPEEATGLTYMGCAMSGFMNDQSGPWSIAYLVGDVGTGSSSGWTETTSASPIMRWKGTDSFKRRARNLSGGM